MATYNPVHINKALADFAVKYTPADLIANLVCPITLKEKASDAYFVFSRRDSATIVDDLVAPTGLPNQKHFDLATDNYSVKRRALKDFIPLEDIGNQDEPLDLESDTIEDLKTALMLAREKRVADLVTTAATYATANKVTLGTPWTNKTTGVPVDDINAGIRACALPPNVIVMDEVTWHALRVHPQIVTTLRGTGGITAGQATQKEVASYFGLEDVYVGNSRYDAANRGQAANYQYIWPQGRCLIARIPKEPRTKDVMLCRTFRWKGFDPGAYAGQAAPAVEDGMIVQTWIDSARGMAGNMGIKLALADDEKMIAADVGYLISAAS